MALLSFNEILKYSKPLWLESTEGMISKVPILFDEKDYEFLVGSDPNKGNFPPSIWSEALKWRYNSGMRMAIKEKLALGIPKDEDVVVLQATRGNQKGSFLFFDINTGQKGLIEKLSGKPNRGEIKKLQSNNDLGSYTGPKYGYDLSKVHEQDEDNPLHFASGMPFMQSQAASDALYGWIYGTVNGVLGEPPATYQGKPVEMMAVDGWYKSQSLKNKQVPCIRKDYYTVFVSEDTSIPAKQIVMRNEPTPILLPGKYVPIRNEYDNFSKKKGGFTGLQLMRSKYWDQLTDDEKKHFTDKKFGPEHFLAREITHKSFYVIGGWSPTTQQKGEHPMFSDEDELEEFLNSKAKNGKWDKQLTDEAKEGVDNFISSRRFEPEGIVMQLMRSIIIDAAKHNLIKNLGDPHFGPIKYVKEKEVIDPEVNHKERIRKAKDYAQTVWQTNITVVGGTRRQREAGYVSDSEGGAAPMVSGKGSRRWVDLTKGSQGVKWIGHSIRYMQHKMEDLDISAKQQEKEAEKATNAHAMVVSRGGAIANVLEKLVLKFATLQATHHSNRGIGENDMPDINQDAALASALSELPSELTMLGIPYDKLPKDVLDHYKKYNNEEWMGKSPSTSQENRGVALLNDLINNGEVEIGNRKVSLQQLATDDSLYDQMNSYLTNLEKIADGPDEKRAMRGALDRLVAAVDRYRGQKGLAVRNNPVAKGLDHEFVASLRSSMGQIYKNPAMLAQKAHEAEQLYRNGHIDESTYKAVMNSLNHLGHELQSEMVGTGAVLGTHPVLPKKRTFNVWGVGGSTSIDGHPIGTKKDKASKNDKRR